jgi:hypothetical protein
MIAKSNLGERTSQLLEAMREQRLIRVSRPFEPTPAMGYVVAVGPGLVLLATVSDAVRLNGYECFRLSDVTAVEPYAYPDFVEKALEKRGQPLPGRPPVSVDSIEDLLTTAGVAFPLVTVHLEKTDPDVCWIGRVLEIVGGHVALREIGPDAVWEPVPVAYPVQDITRVDFGGDYEGALALVGGEPPGN